MGRCFSIGIRIRNPKGTLEDATAGRFYADYFNQTIAYFVLGTYLSEGITNFD